MKLVQTDRLGWGRVVARARVIIDNDFSGDPDDLFQLAHHLLSPSTETRLIIGSHLSVNDPWDPSTSQATNAVAKAKELLETMGLSAAYDVVEGAQACIADIYSPTESVAARSIIAEAHRDDNRPLFYAAGAGLTDLASAWLMDPTIGRRITLVWIGGPEYADLAGPPPGATGPEYNLRIDIAAARVIFEKSDIAIWQVPRNVYRQMLFSHAELLTRIGPLGPLGAYLRASIERVMDWTSRVGFHIGETYVLGDSPLVTLTALQSSFEADPSSSQYVERPAPGFDENGNYLDRQESRLIRVYTKIDTRLTFDDFVAKLAIFSLINS